MNGSNINKEIRKFHKKKIHPCQIEEILTTLCKEGHLVGAMYFYNEFSKKINNRIILKAFEVSGCHLEIRKWLYSLKPSIWSKYQDILSKCFMSACCRNDLDMMNWIYSLPESKIDIRENNDTLFQVTCSFGSLKAAKLLYSLDNKINVCANHYRAFELSCSNNHLKLAKWVYSLGQFHIDDYPDVEGLFRNSADPKSLDLFMWLASLTSNCELIMEKGNLVGYNLITRNRHSFPK